MSKIVKTKIEKTKRCCKRNTYVSKYPCVFQTVVLYVLFFKCFNSHPKEANYLNMESNNSAHENNSLKLKRNLDRPLYQP